METIETPINLFIFAGFVLGVSFSVLLIVVVNLIDSKEKSYDESGHWAIASYFGGKKMYWTAPHSKTSPDPSHESNWCPITYTATTWLTEEDAKIYASKYSLPGLAVNIKS